MIGYIITTIVLSAIFGTLIGRHYRSEAETLKKDLIDLKESSQKKIDKLNKELIQLKDVNDFLRRAKKR